MIVFPMAGRSRRFRRAGYDLPKYMLDLHGRSLFAQAVAGFSAYFDSEPFLFVCRPEADTPGFIAAELDQLPLAAQRYDIVVLDDDTAGQAETVAKGLRAAACPAAERLTIFNIDTFRPGFRHPEAANFAAIDGYLEVVHAEGDHWSFLRPAGPERDWGPVLEVAEKRRISDLCSTGLYYFRTAKMFLDLYDQTALTDPRRLQGGERYVAPLYSRAIAAGQSIWYRRIAPEQVVFCGTPEDYARLRAEKAPAGSR